MLSAGGHREQKQPIPNIIVLVGVSQAGGEVLKYLVRHWFVLLVLCRFPGTSSIIPHVFRICNHIQPNSTIKYIDDRHVIFDMLVIETFCQFFRLT